MLWLERNMKHAIRLRSSILGHFGWYARCLEAGLSNLESFNRSIRVSQQVAQAHRTTKTT